MNKEIKEIEGFIRRTLGLGEHNLMLSLNDQAYLKEWHYARLASPDLKEEDFRKGWLERLIVYYTIDNAYRHWIKEGRKGK